MATRPRCSARAGGAAHGVALGAREARGPVGGCPRRSTALPMIREPSRAGRRPSAAARAVAAAEAGQVAEELDGGDSASVASINH